MNKKLWRVLLGLAVVSLIGVAGAHWVQHSREREARTAAFEAEVKLLEKEDFASIERFQQKLESVMRWNTFVVFQPYSRARWFKEAGLKSDSICETLALISNAREQWWVAALDENDELICATPLKWRFEITPENPVVILRRSDKRGRW